MSGSLAIGVDIGGTKISAAIVDANGSVRERCDKTTRHGDYEGTVNDVVDMARRLIKTSEVPTDVQTIGVAVAAFLDRERSHVRLAANLGWTNRALRHDLIQALGRSVILLNDADAAAWGEYQHGVGRGVKNLVLLTVGTGVGGGVVMNGVLRTGATGLAGEIGHLVVEPNDGRVCPCGGRGCLEQYASGPALCKEALRLAKVYPDAGAELCRVAGDVLSGHHVVEAARSGNRVGLCAIGEIGKWLGIAASHITAVLDPDLIVIGGGMSSAGDLLLDSIRDAFQSHIGVPELRRMPDVVAARLGPDAGMVGAAISAQQYSAAQHVSTLQADTTASS